MTELDPLQAHNKKVIESDWKPMTDSQKINILHEVTIKLDEKVDSMKAEIDTMHRVITGEPRR